MQKKLLIVIGVGLVAATASTYLFYHLNYALRGAPEEG